MDSAPSSPAKPYGKAIGDLSGDDRPDLFISSADGEGMYWYLYPDWQKYAFRTCGSWSEDCQLIDIDCDGDNDVINGNGQGLYWYENPLNTGGIIGAGKWTEHAIGSDGTNIHDLEIADLNGDVDMVLGNIWLENKGKGTDWEEHAYAGNKDVGDLWIEYTIESHITHIHGLAIGDFNKDGYLDIHTSIRHDHPGPRDHVSIWLSSGKTEPEFKEQILAASGSHFSKTGDVDQDGDLDILGANWSGPAGHHADILLWRNKCILR